MECAVSALERRVMFCLLPIPHEEPTAAGGAAWASVEQPSAAVTASDFSPSATTAAYPLSAVPAAMASLSKGGLAAVTRSLAIEFAAKGVRVNAVSPGTTSGS